MFWLQLLALTEKSWIILLRHPIVNLLRCLIVPIAYYVFLSFAKEFLQTSNDLGFGEPAPVRSLSSTIGNKPLYWLQGNPTDFSTPPYDGPIPFTAQQVMDTIIQDLEPSKRSLVRKVENDIELGFACPQSFAGNSPCFGAIEFNSFQRRGSVQDGAPLVNYTLRFAPGLDMVRIPGNNGDVEARTLPLQFALDKAIASLTAGGSNGMVFDQVLEWPYTWETNQQQSERQRRSLLNGVEALVVLAFFIVLLGVPWHVSSNLSSERSMGMSHLLTSAGCSQFARLLSYFSGPTAAYVPAYFIICAPLASQLFTNTNTAITLAIHILPALAMAAYSIFLACFFLRANLSAIIVTAICILGAIIGLLTKNVSSGAQIIIGLIFPPATFVFAFIGVSRFERLGRAANLTSDPPGYEDVNNISILGQILIACLAIILYPILAAWVERIKYYPEPASRWILSPFRRNKSLSKDSERNGEVPSILVSNLTKQYSKTSLAVSDLSFEVKRGGFTGLIGSNGSGKSSVFNCIAGTQTITSGSILIDGYERSQASDSIGLCPQKNVLYEELDARAHVKLFERIKRKNSIKKGLIDEKSQGSKDSTSSSSSQSSPTQDVKLDSFSQSSIDELLLKCDLASKFSSRPGQLSGGQKRKLQLALSIVGHSQTLLVDEASSGLDPQARRAIWKILLEVSKEGRTILFTSHFLDEPDLLADDVIILTAPGKLLAHGSPIYLKETYGKGSLIHTRLTSESLKNRSQTTFKILTSIQEICPSTVLQKNPSQDEITFLIPSSSSDQESIGQILKKLEGSKSDLGISTYDFSGPSLESVFLTLNEDHQNSKDAEIQKQEGIESEKNRTRKGWFGMGKKSKKAGTGVAAATARSSPTNEKGQEEADDSNEAATLTDGRPTGFLPLAWAQFLKRLVIFRRSFMAPVLAILVAIIGSIVPLAFITDRDASCERGFSDREFSLSLSLTSPTVNVAPVVFSPEGTFEDVLGNSLPPTFSSFRAGAGPQPISSIVQQVPQSNFDQAIRTEYLTLPGGGISIVENQPPLIAYRADSDNVFEPAIVLANLISNAELARQWNSTNQPNPEAPPIIYPALRYLSSLSLDNGLGGALKWAVIFGLVQAVWPAFAALYPTAERVNGAKSLALTNGQRPLPLWLGHLGFEFFVVLLATIPVIGVYSSVTENFNYVNLGAFWATLWLTGLATTLQSFVVSLFAPSALAAFAIVAAWNVISFLIFFAAVLLTVSYYVGADLTQQINTIFFVVGILSPAVSASRAAWVALNLFSLLCNGRGGFSDSGIEAITLLGGPILYAILWGVICFLSLLWVDSGSRLPVSIRQLPYLLHLKKPISAAEPESKAFPAADGVSEETERACSPHNEDLLKVQHVSKSFGQLLAVDDVSFSVGVSTCFSLTGINGGGKTTLHSIIRGEQRADEGTVTIDGIDMGSQRTLARSKISSVPQFDGHDPTLTCYEHMKYYSRVKGLPRSQRESNITKVLQLTGIEIYRNRKSRELSGGSARKLSLAIALIGNPKVLLLDELSSGVDSHTKRVLWKTLMKVASGRSTLLTTHSMEEVEALAGRLAIQSSRFLGAGTISELRSKRPAYELQVDLISSTSYPSAKRFVQDLFPGAIESDEASARFEIPLKKTSSSSPKEDEKEADLTVSDLYHQLKSNNEKSRDAGIRSWHISPVSLESIFLHVVRETLSMRENRRNALEA